MASSGSSVRDARLPRLGLLSPGQAEALINTVAATRNTTITRENPILECELPLDGHRFEALIAPVVAAPVFSIRRRPDRVFTLDDYVAAGIMTASGMRLICRAVEDRLNIVVAGDAMHRLFFSQEEAPPAPAAPAPAKPRW
jgi:Flp pilus assembly CpaF family ATPase